MNIKTFAGATALMGLAAGHAARAGSVDLITNSNFNQPSYGHSSALGTGYGVQGVTGCTAGTGHQIDIFANTWTTASPPARTITDMSAIRARAPRPGSSTQSFTGLRTRQRRWPSGRRERRPAFRPWF